MNASSGEAFDELAKLFPAGPHRHALGLRPLDLGRYFSRPDAAELLVEKRELLAADGERWTAARPGSEALVAAAADFLRSYRSGWATAAADPLRQLAGELVPDFVLLADRGEGLSAEAGAVCFPSGWSFPTKLGLPLVAIHGVVPGLNDEMREKIDTFLRRLAPGQGYARENWGLSSRADRSQDPAAGIPAPVLDPATLFFRVERQALVGLPAAADGRSGPAEGASSGVLFLIDLFVYPLAEAAACSAAFRAGFAHALRALPPAMAEYKRLDACREAVARWLLREE